MIFRPELIAKIESGDKTVTRRRADRGQYKPGLYSVQPGRGQRHVGHIRILSVREEPLSAITPEDCVREGFPGLDSFMDYWEELHGRIDLATRVKRIEFRREPKCTGCSDLSARPASGRLDPGRDVNPPPSSRGSRPDTGADPADRTASVVAGGPRKDGA